jgi:hypothetical protein
VYALMHFDVVDRQIYSALKKYFTSVHTVTHIRIYYMHSGLNSNAEHFNQHFYNRHSTSVTVGN